MRMDDALPPEFLAGWERQIQRGFDQPGVIENGTFNADTRTFISDTEAHAAEVAAQKKATERQEALDSRRFDIGNYHPELTAAHRAKRAPAVNVNVATPRPEDATAATAAPISPWASALKGLSGER